MAGTLARGAGVFNRLPRSWGSRIRDHGSASPTGPKRPAFVDPGVFVLGHVRHTGSAGTDMPRSATHADIGFGLFFIC